MIRKDLQIYGFHITKLYIHKLDDTVNEYNNTYHRTIKMKPDGVKSSTYIGFDKQNYMENPEFDVDDHVRISKYKIIFAKVYVPNQPEIGFMKKNNKRKSLELKK